ncbi:MAG: bacterial Ig-like domain-containing protein [Oscillospiraceae bacterium]|nr:bacterial Ig-like domain-containing protein [Oscillospiraceae bacterium]
MKKLKKVFAAIAALTTMTAMMVPVCSAEATKAEAKTDVIYGDVDNNGVIELTDLTYLSLYLIGDYDFTESQLNISDMNKDGKVNIADLPTLKSVFIDSMIENNITDKSEDEVSDDKISSVEWVESPKIVYYIGEEFDVSRGKFSAIAKDGDEAVCFGTSEATIDSSAFDNTKAGSYTITASYGGKDISYSVMVLEEGEAYFELTRMPDKTEYFDGEKLDITGGEVSGRCGDQEFYDVPLSDPMFDCNLYKSKDGYTLEINIDEYSYFIECEFKNIDDSNDYVNFYWLEQPKKVYYIGEEFDYETGSVYGNGYENGIHWDIFSFAPLKLSEMNVDISDFDNTKPGTYTIHVTTHGDYDLSYEVQVVEAE